MVSLTVVHRPCRNYLRTYCADSFQISVVASPGQYRYFVEFLKKKMHFQVCQEFFFVFELTMLTWDPMEAKTSKRYSSHKSLFNLFKLFLNFLSGPHKSTVLEF